MSTESKAPALPHRTQQAIRCPIAGDDGRACRERALMDESALDYAKEAKAGKKTALVPSVRRPLIVTQVPDPGLPQSVRLSFP